MHSRSSFSKTVQILTSTSDGGSPAVSACHGASQNVYMLLIVGAGVTSEELPSEELVVIGVGVSKLYPHSEEKVTT